MKYAVFSDIHGNIDAFRSMLDALRDGDIEGYLFLGDLVGYYYHPALIMEELGRLPNCRAVLGNHDALYIDALSDPSVRLEAAQTYGSAYWDLDMQTGKHLRSLPVCMTLEVGVFKVMMCHGSPGSPLSGRIYPDTALDGFAPDCDLLLLGHTHYQMLRNCSNGCKVVNPGSLGQPRDGNGFSYCIIDFLSSEVEFRQAVFDLSPLYEEIARKDAGIAYLSDVLKRNGRE